MNVLNYWYAHTMTLKSSFLVLAFQKANTTIGPIVSFLFVACGFLSSPLFMLYALFFCFCFCTVLWCSVHMCVCVCACVCVLSIFMTIYCNMQLLYKLTPLTHSCTSATVRHLLFSFFVPPLQLPIIIYKIQKRL